MTTMRSAKGMCFIAIRAQILGVASTYFARASQIAELRRIEPAGERYAAVDHECGAGDVARHGVRQQRERHRREVFALAEPAERNVARHRRIGDEAARGDG